MRFGWRALAAVVLLLAVLVAGALTGHLHLTITTADLTQFGIIAGALGAIAGTAGTFVTLLRNSFRHGSVLHRIERQTNGAEGGLQTEVRELHAAIRELRAALPKGKRDP